MSLYAIVNRTPMTSMMISTDQLYDHDIDKFEMDMWDWI